MERLVDLDRWRVGDAWIDALTREIYMPGARRPVRITPKALAVLRVLASQPGQVVTRRALLDEVWAETLPTDDVLTQAITQLRKAFGSGAAGAEEGRAYIETIAKSGYRLMRDVTAAEPESGNTVSAGDLTAPAADEVPGADAVVPEPAATAGSRRSPRGWWAAAIVLSCALAAVVALLWWPALRGDAADAPDAQALRLITSSLGFKSAPSLSPDGSQVAYAASGATPGSSVILVQPTRNAPARVLAAAPSGSRVSDSEPRWSPDGREIAFVRRSGTTCAVLVAAATHADVREVVRCDGAQIVSFDWTADGRGLVFGSMDGANGAPGLRVFDLATAAWTALDYAHAPGAIDHGPRVSPDGKWILFARNPQLGDLWRVPATGGQAEQLTRLNAELRGWTWASGGHVVFGQRVDSEVRLYSLDPASGAVSDLGLEDSQAPSMVPSNGALAFVRRHLRFGLFRVEVDPAGGIRKERLFASTGRDHTPAVSPDGSRLAFGSDRAGPYELWLAPLGGPAGEPVPVQGVTPVGSHAPTWSVDGRHLLVAGIEADDPAATALFEVEAVGGTARRLDVPVRNPVQALRLDASRLVVVAQAQDSPLQLLLLGMRNGRWQPVRALQDVSQFHHDPDRDRILFTRLSGDGLWEVAADLRPGSVRQVDPHHPRRTHYRSWSPSLDGAIAYIVGTPECRSQLARIGGAAESAPVCLSAGRPVANSGFSSSRDGTLYLSMVIDEGMEIGFTQLPAPRQTPMRGVVNLLFPKGKPVS